MVKQNSSQYCPLADHFSNKRERPTTEANVARTDMQFISKFRWWRIVDVRMSTALARRIQTTSSSTVRSMNGVVRRIWLQYLATAAAAAAAARLSLHSCISEYGAVSNCRRTFQISYCSTKVLAAAVSATAATVTKTLLPKAFPLDACCRTTRVDRRRPTSHVHQLSRSAVDQTRLSFWSGGYCRRVVAARRCAMAVRRTRSTRNAYAMLVCVHGRGCRIIRCQGDTQHRAANAGTVHGLFHWS